jgi:transposase
MLPEQLPNESAKAYAAFVAYCETGTQRSVRDVAQKLDKSSTIIGRWSAQHRWQERVRAYDAAIAAERAEILRQQRREEIERLRTLAQADAENLRKLARGLGARLAQAIDQVEAAAIEPQHMASMLRTIAQSLETATNLDAAALGIDEVLAYLKEQPE